MKKLLSIFITVLFLSIAVSCSQQQKENAVKPPEMIDVDLSINPEKGELNKPITFEAKVTQGKENVNDADAVVFEIWRAKDEHHEKVEIKHAENGVYRLEKSFAQEGTYYFISHVTARDMHNMPKKEFIVGTPSDPEDPKAQGSMDDMKMDDQQD
ncbi:FixH family protein [Neobacillus sp. MM2021_6]|uniref:FixH family protein n=1 Tax=Bacillaceae TaxID=186817 RepID=UPI00140A17C2|nr:MULTISPECIES: FixH family protein [Bacillaceae]MBO0958321.1 FixH family protein [Neobacillus sp. MM2021_6]NHC17921.1 FixH family protein [Bacillus sp. MM2020_4]WML40215.1 FixH family protein [Neobacillus sp. OS1-2]